MLLRYFMELRAYELNSEILVQISIIGISLLSFVVSRPIVWGRRRGVSLMFLKPFRVSSGQQAGRFLPLSLYGRLLCPWQKRSKQHPLTTTTVGWYSAWWISNARAVHFQQFETDWNTSADFTCLRWSLSLEASLLMESFACG